MAGDGIPRCFVAFPSGTRSINNVLSVGSVVVAPCSGDEGVLNNTRMFLKTGTAQGGGGPEFKACDSWPKLSKAFREHGLDWENLVYVGDDGEEHNAMHILSANPLEGVGKKRKTFLPPPAVSQWAEGIAASLLPPLLPSPTSTRPQVMYGEEEAGDEEADGEQRENATLELDSLFDKTPLLEAEAGGGGGDYLTGSNPYFGLLTAQPPLPIDNGNSACPPDFRDECLELLSSERPGNPMPHQLQGAHWLHLLHRSGRPGAILADSPGVGKTLQILLFVLMHPGTDLHGSADVNRATLVACPDSIVEQWMGEAKKWAPSTFKCRTFEGGAIEEGVDMLVIGFSKLMQELHKLAAAPRATRRHAKAPLPTSPLACGFVRIVLDEVQICKGNTALALHHIPTLRRVVASGTPADDLSSLKHLLRFVLPDFEGVRTDVEALFRDRSIAPPSESLAAVLAALRGTCMYRPDAGERMKASIPVIRTDVLYDPSPLEVAMRKACREYMVTTRNVVHLGNGLFRGDEMHVKLGLVAEVRDQMKENMQRHASEQCSQALSLAFPPPAGARSTTDNFVEDYLSHVLSPGDVATILRNNEAISAFRNGLECATEVAMDNGVLQFMRPSPPLPHRACDVMTLSIISDVFVTEESRRNFGEHLQSVRQAEDNAVSVMQAWSGGGYTFAKARDDSMRKRVKSLMLRKQVLRLMECIGTKVVCSLCFLRALAIQKDMTILYSLVLPFLGLNANEDGFRLHALQRILDPDINANELRCASAVRSVTHFAASMVQCSVDHPCTSADPRAYIQADAARDRCVDEFRARITVGMLKVWSGSDDSAKQYMQDVALLHQASLHLTLVRIIEAVSTRNHARLDERLRPYFPIDPSSCPLNEAFSAFLTRSLKRHFYGRTEWTMSIFGTMLNTTRGSRLSQLDVLPPPWSAEDAGRRLCAWRSLQDAMRAVHGIPACINASRAEQAVSLRAASEEGGGTPLVIPDSVWRVPLDPMMSDTKTTRFLQLVLNRLDDTSVVVFCATKQRCNDLALLLGGLEGHTVSCFTLKKKKDGDVCKFLESDRGVLFIDLSTSSAGLTLVTSNVLIFFDDPGTAAQREQAEARVRRTGQTRPVEIFSFEEA